MEIRTMGMTATEPLVLSEARSPKPGKAQRCINAYESAWRQEAFTPYTDSDKRVTIIPFKEIA